MANLKEFGIITEGRKRAYYVGYRAGNTMASNDTAKVDVSGVAQLVKSASLRPADDPQRRFLLRTAAERVVRVIEEAPTPMEKADVMVTLFEATKVPRPNEKKGKSKSK